MPLLATIIVFNFIGSIVSLIGGLLLIWKKKITEKLTPYLVAFAAGSMLSVSFFDLLPEGVENGQELGFKITTVFLFCLIGIVTFFLIERFILWSHHHHGKVHEETHPTITLLIIGDSIHNFLDGLTIAATFLVSIPLGIVTSLAVGAHEIPQEMGDFATLLSKGINRNTVIIINAASALVSFLGVITGYYFLQNTKIFIPLLLGFAAGNFIYIASSDLIPEIHSVYNKESAIKQTIFFILGIATVYLFKNLLEG